LFETTSGISYVVSLLRHRISDPKTVYTNVVDEDAGTAAGSVNEVFLTDNMPVVSGYETELRADRWNYVACATVEAAANIRGYIFSNASGSFLIPNGATLPTAGDRIKLSYTWRERQPYRFNDTELKLYLGDAISTVNNVYYNFGYTFVNSGVNNLDISPVIKAEDLAPHIYAKYASYLIKKELEAEGFGDRIYVKDINITIDTSKGLADLQKSAKDLLDDFKNIIIELRQGDIAKVACKIDTYNTVSYGDVDGTYSSFTPSREFWS
jgi:hypothetical protein